MVAGPRKDSDKLRGGYYTPAPVAQLLAEWAIRSNADRVLEPSCGDGTFVAAAMAQLCWNRDSLSETGGQVVGVELIPDEAQKAQERTHAVAQIVTGDFFDWLERSEAASFDVVLGNPPFIRYQNFPEPHRTRAMHLMQREGLVPNRLTNVWVPFVVGACTALRTGGRLAMVLPAELLQVTYASQLRRYLTSWFRRITIFACNEMFFENAEQEVILLAAEGKLKAQNSANKCDISLVETNTVRELLGRGVSRSGGQTSPKFVEHATEKWLKYFLDPEEIQCMRAMRAHPRIGELIEHATIDVGIVTGRNEFFVLSRSEVEAHDLHKFVVPLVGRSAQLTGAVLRGVEHRRFCKDDKKVYLLHLSQHSQDRFTRGLRSLLDAGERSGCHLGYKCSIRNPWYNVPAVWEPDCFFFRQIYDFPRVVVNRAKATSKIGRASCRERV